MASSSYTIKPINLQAVEQSRLQLLEEKQKIEKNVQQKKAKVKYLEGAYSRAQDAYIAEEKKLSEVEGKLASTDEASKATEILGQMTQLLGFMMPGITPKPTSVDETPVADITSVKERLAEAPIAATDGEFDDLIDGMLDVSEEDLNIDDIERLEKTDSKEDDSPDASGDAEEPTTPPRTQQGRGTKRNSGTAQKTPRKRTRNAKTPASTKKKVRFRRPLVLSYKEPDDSPNDQDNILASTAE